VAADPAKDGTAVKNNADDHQSFAIDQMVRPGPVMSARPEAPSNSRSDLIPNIRTAQPTVLPPAVSDTPRIQVPQNSRPTTTANKLLPSLPTRPNTMTTTPYGQINYSQSIEPQRSSTSPINSGVNQTSFWPANGYAWPNR
jgi:hypothetical protein